MNTTPYTPELIARFNNLSHFPKDVSRENNRFNTWAAELTNTTQAAVTRYGLAEMPDDVAAALHAVLAAEVDSMRVWIRAREIAPPVSVVGPANYNRLARPERADRMIRAQLDRQKKAEERLRLALHRHSPRAAISGDDPEAIEKLTAKIEDAEQTQTMMKTANKIIGGKKQTQAEKETALVALGWTATQAAILFVPDSRRAPGFPAYRLTNNNANIKRMKARVAELERKRAQTTQEAAFDGGRVVDDVEANRLMIFFDDKPDAEKRTNLKRNGFKWSPTSGAWQRFRGPSARAYARTIVGALEFAPRAETSSELGALLFSLAPSSELPALEFPKAEDLPALQSDGLTLVSTGPDVTTRHHGSIPAYAAPPSDAFASWMTPSLFR